jgi:hypothetical protein
MNRRRFVENDYIKQLLENDRQMLQNQCKRLKQDEELLKSATGFFNSVTTYISSCVNNLESNPDFPVFNSFPTFVTTNNMKFTNVQHTSSTDNVNRADLHNGAFHNDKPSPRCNELHSNSTSSQLMKPRTESNSCEDKMQGEK